MRNAERVGRRAFLRSGARTIAGVALLQGLKRNVLAAPRSARPLSRDEARVITAAADRIWPGAGEAGFLAYISRALSSTYAGDLRSYKSGAHCLDMAARTYFGRQFPMLRGEEQDRLLSSLQSGSLRSMPGLRGTKFFALLRQHVIEAVLSDPVYGGNRDFVGWKAVGYPGPRRQITASQQTSMMPLDLPFQSIADLR